MPNSIYMHLEDREKNAFITDRGLYCYKVLPFGLKNAGATYQRLVNKMFRDQIGRNMEVYVDDMLVKSVLPEGHVGDLHETFRTLKHYGMKLNLAKCAFGVASANPKKIRAVLDIQSPKNTKQLQQLTGRIAALNRFISQSTDKCLPFFKILRIAFEWSEECEEAFDQLKKYLTSPPLLSRVVPREALYLYVAISPTTVSGALIQEEDGTQKPVYFVSRALRGAEERCPQMEKLAFALTIASRKLRSYFQAYTIRVLTEYPLKKILRKLDLSSRLANWAIELGEIKKDETWVVYVDGSSIRKNGGAGVVLISPDGEELCNSLKLEFKTTNNEAEYEIVLAGLGLAREMGAEFVELRSDSQVIVGHIQGEFEARGGKMKQYLSKVQNLQKAFKKFCIIKIPREENERADQLAQRTSAVASDVEKPKEPIQTLTRPAVSETVSIFNTETVPEWQRSIREYLEQRILLLEKKSATQVKTRAAGFTVINGILYKQGFMLPLLKCISKEEGNYVLREIHEDIVGLLPRGKGNVRFAVVAVDYFTKWAEVKALVNITAKSIERFLWKNVICRYAIPHAFMSLRPRTSFSRGGLGQESENTPREVSDTKSETQLESRKSDAKGKTASELPRRNTTGGSNPVCSLLCVV
ncbi:uncharacterized protein LOC132162275 [Corylus avellana]|uniref:uncharacterized protein LOC132162275 n=1 Tax=Corylus avellana TaxID=13451 RepID=UPI00286C3F23|nr:uncharacterized protein LOC132162275 [Corylus avellana]